MYSIKVALLQIILCTLYMSGTRGGIADPKSMYYMTRHKVLGLGVPETDLQLRQNLGLMFRQHKRLLTNKLSFLAHFNLDFPISEYRQWLGKMNSPITAVCSIDDTESNEYGICEHHKANILMLEQTRQSKIQKILQDLDFIDNIGHNTVINEDRTRRGIFSFGVAKFLFNDLVKKTDFINSLDRIAELESVSQNISGTFEYFKKDLTSVLNVYNERLINLRNGFTKHNEAVEALAQTQDSLKTDLTELKSAYHNMLSLSSQLEVGNLKLFLLNDLERQVHSWVSGLMALSNHKITQDLIPYDTLRYMLWTVSEELKLSHPSLKVAFQKVEDYYSLENAFAYITKHDGIESLKVVLDVPLIEKDKDILLYQVDSLELPIKSYQGKQNSTKGYAEGTTRISNVPEYLGIASNAQGIRTFVELNASDLVDCRELTSSTISCNQLWVPKKFTERLTCATATYLDKVENVSQLCEHDFIVKQNSSTKAIQIAPNKYFLTSGTNDVWWLNCTNGDFMKFEACVSCVIELNCSCSLITPEFTIGAMVNCPKDDKPVTLKHGVNIHLMKLLSNNTKDLTNVSGSTFLSHETQFGINASIYRDFTDAEQIVAKDEELTLNLKALFRNMIGQKLSFVSKSDFLHHGFGKYLTETDISTVWKVLNIIELIAICFLFLLSIKLYMRTSTLSRASKGPLTALVTAATPSVVKGMAHDFDFVTYQKQTQDTSSNPATVQWYHTMFLTFGIVICCAMAFYLLYQCCCKRCYSSQMFFRPDLTRVSQPHSRLELVLQTQLTRVSIFVGSYPYEARDLTFESPTGSIKIQPQYTLKESKLSISWHGAVLFYDSLLNTLDLPEQVKVSRFHRETVRNMLNHDNVSLHVLVSDEVAFYRTILRLSGERGSVIHPAPQPLRLNQNVSYPHVRFENNTTTAVLHPPHDYYRTAFSTDDEDSAEEDSPVPHSSHTEAPKRNPKRMGQKIHKRPSTNPLGSNDSLCHQSKSTTKPKVVHFAEQTTAKQVALNDVPPVVSQTLASVLYSYKTADEFFEDESKHGLEEDSKYSSLSPYINMNTIPEEKEDEMSNVDSDTTV